MILSYILCNPGIHSGTPLPDLSITGKSNEERDKEDEESNLDMTWILKCSSLTSQNRKILRTGFSKRHSTVVQILTDHSNHEL